MAGEQNGGERMPLPVFPHDIVRDIVREAVKGNTPARAPGVADATQVGVAPWGSFFKNIDNLTDPDYLLVRIPAASVARRLTTLAAHARLVASGIGWDPTWPIWSEFGVWAGGESTLFHGGPPNSGSSETTGRMLYRGSVDARGMNGHTVTWPRGSGPIIYPGEGVFAFMQCPLMFDPVTPVIAQRDGIVFLTIHGYDEIDAGKFVAK